MNREIVSGQKMKRRIGPLAKLDFFTQKKFNVFTFNPAHTSLMGISSPVRLPSPQMNDYG